MLRGLPPGKYEMHLQQPDNLVYRMKRYYFAMETKLSFHLGMSKDELHENLKAHLGHHVDLDTGEITYQSISSVETSDEMLQRILQFQQFAAEHFQYTFEPFKYEENDGTIQLEVNNNPPGEDR